MQIKNAKLSFLVLFILCVFSFSFFVIAKENNENQNIFLDNDQDGLSDQEEKAYGTDPNNADTDGDSYSDGVEVNSGYNPLKPAPGDKLIPEETAKNQLSKNQTTSNLDQENLTQKLTTEISGIIKTSQANGKDPDLTEIQIITSEMLNQELTDEDFPEVKKEDLKIKKQNYKNLSEEKRKEQMKKDFTDYELAILYILTSNSPEPITSINTIDAVFNKILQDSTTAITEKNPEKINKLLINNTKILEQMKSIEVPEEAVDLQIKGMKLIIFSSNLTTLIMNNKEDPLSDVVNLSKVNSFFSAIMGYIGEFQLKSEYYGINYANKDIQKEIKKMGIDPSAIITNNLGVETISTTEVETTETE